MLHDETVAGQQKRLAILQLLQLAYEKREIALGENQDQKRAFLRYVRKLDWYGAAKQLRQIPEAVSDIDAVRLLTVHAAKGLEFDVVFVPSLGRGRFPASRQWNPCPPPEGLLASKRDEHDEEEECLFFVALSRARDILCLSRARRYGRSNRGPSDMLTGLARHLPHPPNGSITWKDDRAGSTVLSNPVQMLDRSVFSLNKLEVYMRCPRQFFYEVVLSLGGRSEDTPYVLFHRAVYRVLRWLHGEKEGGIEISTSEALAHLAEDWSKQGPVDHPYESIYRRQAEELVKQAAKQDMRYRSRPIDSEWEVSLEHGIVRFRPDRECPEYCVNPKSS